MHHVYPSDGGKFRYKSLMDFAWRYYGHEIKAPRKAEEIYRLALAYTRFLYAKEKDGFTGFVSGSQWHRNIHAYKKKEHYYEIGWVGQSASMANALLYDYIKNGGNDNMEMAMEAHDSWLKHTETNGDFLSAKMGYLPMLSAYKKSKDGKYLDAAVRAFDFYYDELERQGFTTAGALDTYSIDKESASPLLRDALALYEITQDKAYVAKAEKIAWYLCTWMMHFTVDYPEDCLISQLGYDTFGSTAVSTPHQALDQYALRDVLSFLKLYEIAGYKQWKERAIAFWCNACQGISDGTLFINRRLRLAGSQDEAIFHTRWGRRVSKPFGLSQWLPAWPCAFRLENLRWHEDWSVFDEGLTEIEGSLRFND